MVDMIEELEIFVDPTFCSLGAKKKIALVVLEDGGGFVVSMVLMSVTAKR